MSYQQLNETERERIYELQLTGLGPSAIGRQLGRDKSTISRELRRNRSDGRYSARQAQEMAQRRRAERPVVRKLDRPEIQQAVRAGLIQHWSPEQIAQRLRLEVERTPEHWVSRQGIYRWLERGGRQFAHFRGYLRHGRYRPRGRVKRRIAIPNRVSITARPPDVATRERSGDWEGDTIVGAGQSGYLVTLVERQSGLVLIIKTDTKQAAVVNRAILRRLSVYSPEWRRTLTVDNGTEFAGHEALTRRLGLPVYFANPYASYERGCNENCNGLIRQFFPKGTDIKQVSHAAVANVEQTLNNRPRKRLDYLTPYEFFKYSNVALEL